MHTNSTIFPIKLPNHGRTADIIIIIKPNMTTPPEIGTINKLAIKDNGEKILK
jgi:hypothetical protein